MESKQTKFLPFYVYNILNEHSDEQHILTRKQIDDYLNNTYGVSVTRKTLYKQITTLKELGVDIETPESKVGGYYLKSRTFTQGEVNMLTNAVHASRFISETQSRELIKKILSTQSKHTKKAFFDEVYMANPLRTPNKQFFKNLETLSNAINQKHPVKFHYCSYDMNKKLTNRKERFYTVHPYKVVCANNHYYLICNSDGHSGLSHYRIDRMRDLSIIKEEARTPLEENFDPYQYTKTKLFMYGGDIIKIKLRCNKIMLNDVIELFGDEIFIFEDDEDHFITTIEACERGAIYFILQFMMNCEVLEPQSLRDKVVSILHNCLATYEK